MSIKSTVFRPLSLGIWSLTGVLASASSMTTAQSAAIEEIVVTRDGSQVLLPDAYAGGQVARGGRVGMFGNLDMMDSPFSGTSFTQDLMLDQQTVSVADVLQNDPVVRVAKGFGNFQELYMIRGFPVFSDDMTYNGVFGILPRQFVASEFLERVEVFRGASTFLNGAAPGGSSIGGSVNLVPKRAPAQPLTRVTAGYEGGEHGYLAFDGARRFGAEDAVGVRINVARRDGETAVDGQSRELTVLSLGTDYSGERLRVSADLGFQDHHIDAPRPSVTPNAGIPATPDADANFAQPWTFTDERQWFGVVRGEYDLNDNTSAWLAAGMRDGEEGNVLANPNANPDGTTTAYRFDNTRADKVYSGEAGIRTSFDTGSINHRLSLTASTFTMESRNAYAFSSFAGFAGDLYSPQPVTPPAPDFFVGGDLSSPLTTEETGTSSIALADMLSLLDDRLMVTVGGRYQRIETRTFDYNSGARLSSYDEGRLTPVLGVVYQASDRISVYGNYIEGLVAGEVAPATSGGNPVLNAGEVFEPYQSEQVELGVKYDGGNLGGSVSVFDTSRPSSFVENGIFAPQGEQQNRGLELSVFGAPASNIRVLGGVTVLRAEMNRTLNGSLDGKDAVGAPDAQYNVNVEWDVSALPGLTLEMRHIYTSSQYANAANTIDVESWHRTDLGARYRWQVGGKDVTLRARLQNMGDEADWVSVGGFPGSNYLVLSSPRTLLLSGTVDF